MCVGVGLEVVVLLWVWVVRVCVVCGGVVVDVVLGVVGIESVFFLWWLVVVVVVVLFVGRVGVVCVRVAVKSS